MEERTVVAVPTVNWGYKKIKKKALPLMPASSQNVEHLRLNIAKIWIQETFVQTLLFHL